MSSTLAVLVAALLVLLLLPFLLVGGALWWYLRPGRLLKQIGRENAIRRRDAVGPLLLVVFFGDAETVSATLSYRLRHGAALAGLGLVGAAGALLSTGVLL